MSARPQCPECDMWRPSRETCGIVAICDLPDEARVYRKQQVKPWFDVITAPPDPNATRPPGWTAERARRAIGSIGYDDAAARAYLGGEEQTCAVYRPRRRIPASTEEGSR